MATYKCKMCGGALDLQANATVVECEYCGTRQTLPKLDNEKRANLYDRANHFRRNNEFDKASAIYEQILNEDTTDAEAYWSLVLCRYGIEYVEDPASHKRIPTVNRAQYTSIFNDDNYKSALEYADSYQRIIYEEEAKAINEIQKGILAISQREEPFDVFICYKETDNAGRRTPDSVLAQELYYQLTNEGFKVFFARITLEDKLGSAYEPYIFAALNSAKVMVVLGTRPEHFNAVWVKNEWSRYLALIKQGQKKMLIPAYRDMDPYDLPEEFSHLQAQDMSKLGFMQDLIRGIKKIVNKDEPTATATKETVVTAAAPSGNATPLLKRVEIFLEDGSFAEANEYCERVLDIDPENADAYVYKLLIQMRVKNIEDLKSCRASFGDTAAYRNALRFADEETANKLREYNHLVTNNLITQSKISKRVNALREQKRKTEGLITWKNREKQSLEASVKKREEKIKRLSDPKAKQLAIITLLPLPALILALIVIPIIICFFFSAFSVSIMQEEQQFISIIGATIILMMGYCAYVLPYLLSFLLFVYGIIMIFWCFKLLKILGWHKAISFANIEFGIFSFVLAIILLVKSSQKSLMTEQALVNRDKEKINTIAGEIDSAVKTLNDINNALSMV